MPRNSVSGISIQLPQPSRSDLCTPDQAHANKSKETLALLLRILFQYMLYMLADLFHSWTNQHEEIAERSYVLAGMISIVQNGKGLVLC